MTGDKIGKMIMAAASSFNSVQIPFVCTLKVS